MNILDRIKSDIRGAKILAEWIGSGSEPVSKELANARAAHCIKCPGRHNKFDHRRIEPGVAEAIRQQESIRKKVSLTTQHDPRLFSCLDSNGKKGCGCYLKLKVWVPIEHQGDFEMPHYCWVTKERGAAGLNKRPEKTITINRQAAFGDVIMATAIADKLKQRGFNVEFKVASVIAPILAWHPSVSRVIVDKSHPHDVDLDNTYERNMQRTSTHVAELFLDVVKDQGKQFGLNELKATNLTPYFPLTPEEKAEIADRFKEYPRPWVCINHRSQSWPSRSASPEVLVAASKLIKGTCFWTHPSDPPPGVIKANTRSFRELMALLSVSDLCIAVDSGPMHAASAVKCPIIALEQSIPIHLRLSNQVDHTVISAPVDCVRCSEWKCPKDEKNPPCQKFDPRLIADAANKRLEGKGKVSVVIPVYKPHQRLERCVNAIPSDVEVIVSLDGDAKVEAQGFTALPSTGTRQGFGKTCTRGARHANGEFILFLNDDCYLDPGAIDKLMDEMKPGVAVVGCLLRYPDGRIQHGGTARSGDRGGFGHIDHGRFTPSITKPKEMEFVTFAAALVRRKAFFEVGGFDEEFDTYCEDSDLCLRLREKGWKIMYTPHATAIHDESQTTSPMKSQLWQKSADVFYERWKHIFG